MSKPTRLSLLLVTFALLAPVGLALQAPTSAAPAAATSSSATKPQKPKPIKLFTLSGRSDLISAGDAIVVIQPAKGLRRSDVKVFVDKLNISKSFKLRRGGRYAAYLTGLKVGANVVTAKAPGFAGRLVITNHPNGGPLFSGPQLKPYQCQPTAKDAQCNEPAAYDFLYKSTNPLAAGLKPYDPADPPRDVATTTTDQRIKVPFIVRRERGYQDRDRYTILTLFNPKQKWTRWAPQEQFNHKLVIPHGGGCGSSYAPGDPPLDDYSGTVPAIPGIASTYLTALGRGFAVLSTALDNTGHQCNVSIEAESLVMAKERFVEQYGALRYTIGTGCSGGSIAQQTIANAYPGIYQGLLTTCSYPDVLTAGAQFADYHLLRLYFENPTKWAPGVIWTPLQFAQVEGHITHLNAIVADEGLFKAALNPEFACPGTKEPVAGDRSTRFDSEINPGGVRCSVLDMIHNLIGPRPKSVWSSFETQAGKGFAGVPFANTGVQYGLKQLLAGQITTAMFLDLNAKLGGLDINSDPVPERIEGDPASVARAYRTGMVNEGGNMENVAMINFGGPDPGIAHDYAHAFWMEDRLKRAQGHTDNRVMWFGLTPLIGDPRWANESLVAMDRWLAAVERDKSKRPLAQKIAQDKPKDLTDRCFNVPGLLQVSGADDEVDCVLPPALQLHLSTPREQAGGNVFNDILSCPLRPLNRADYAGLLLPLSDADWAKLQQIFPEGVCDQGKPGIGQQYAQTWLTYGTANKVTIGGTNLPAIKPRDAAGWASPAFRSLLEQ